MKQPSPSASSYYRLPHFLLLGMAMWLGACAATAMDRTAWIQVGKTTKADVIAEYGEPDLVRADEEGETATYRPVARTAPPVQVPMAQAGPLGTSTTRMQTIEPGLGKKDSAARPQKEVQIRYDAQGIVRGVTE